MSFILEESSPVCDLLAAVDKSEDAYYFYLMESPDLSPKVVRILWLCNRKPAPAELDFGDRETPKAPMLPAAYVNAEHAPGGMELEASELKIFWYPSGDCAALIYKGSLLATIPPYAGLYEFPGFSRYIKGQHRYGWELPHDQKDILERLNEGVFQWKAIADEDVFHEWEAQYMAAALAFSGNAPEHYLHLNKDGLPHRRLWMTRKNGVCYNFTIGMGQVEMPRVQLLFKGDYWKLGRIELGFACVEAHAKLAEYMVAVMDTISQMPWQERDLLAHGHTIGFDKIRGFAGFLLVDPAMMPGMEAPKLPEYQNCPVHLLWIVPITEQELNFRNTKGPEALLRKVFLPEKLHIYDGTPKILT